jgi:hypothetical protein
MQPKRDPADRRYWPARLGGTGQGFTRQGKERSPAYYGSLRNPQGTLGHRPRMDAHGSSPDTVRSDARTVDQEAVKARGRLLAIATMDALEAKRDSMDVSSLVDTLNGAIKAASVGVTANHGGGLTLNVAQLHLDSLRRMRAPEASATLLPSNEVASRDTASDAAVVSDDDTTGCA